MNQSILDSAVGLPGRYALSLFEIAKEEKYKNFIQEIDTQLMSLSSLIDNNNDFKSVIKSPIFSTDEQLSIMNDILETMKIDGIIKNFIGVLCENRRLSLLPDIIKAFHSFLLNLNKQATAKVTSAKPLSDKQKENIKSMLSEHFSLDVDVEVIIDEEILGGLVVQMGSKMIDTSLLTRLKSIKNVMNEV
ncbi:MAG: F0F1 ATP synthase subunit delta [Pseudomonadota bacterium]|nr:F0F1 ATP synthase subunit delta [Pseudomonadota bacterium]